MRADAIADGEDSFQVVMVQCAGYVATTLQLNYPEFPDSCIGFQLPFVVDVYEVLIDRFDRYLVQLCDHPLSEPDGFAVEPYLKPEGSVAVDNDLAFAWGRL
jgi:hypothetical protein